MPSSFTCVAECRSVLQYVAVCHDIIHLTHDIIHLTHTTHCNILQHTATLCNTHHHSPRRAPHANRPSPPRGASRPSLTLLLPVLQCVLQGELQCALEGVLQCVLQCVLEGVLQWVLQWVLQCVAG